MYKHQAEMEIYMTHEEKIIERLKTEQMLSAEELDCLLCNRRYRGS